MVSSVEQDKMSLFLYDSEITVINMMKDRISNNGFFLIFNMIHHAISFIVSHLLILGGVVQIPNDISFSLFNRLSSK